jgi:hypothetical protein
VDIFLTGGLFSDKESEKGAAMLRPLSEGVQVLEVPFRIGGLELGGRMTVVRLPDGGLWIHSPVRLDATVRAAYPEARVVAPAGLRRKRPELRLDAELTDTPEPAWAAVLSQQLMRGMPKLDEFVFLHRPSRTLLLTDLAFHIRESPSWLTRTYLRLCRTYGKLAPTLLLKSMVKDRAALRASVDTVLGWDFERVVVCHGEVLEHGGREALRDGFSWL